jgi:hypothetical protein
MCLLSALHHRTILYSRPRRRSYPENLEIGSCPRYIFPVYKSPIISKWPGGPSLGAPSTIALLLNVLPTKEEDPRRVAAFGAHHTRTHTHSLSLSLAPFLALCCMIAPALSEPLPPGNLPDQSDTGQIRLHNCVRAPSTVIDLARSPRYTPTPHLLQRQLALRGSLHAPHQRRTCRPPPSQLAGKLGLS